MQIHLTAAGDDKLTIPDQQWSAKEFQFYIRSANGHVSMFITLSQAHLAQLLTAMQHYLSGGSSE